MPGKLKAMKVVSQRANTLGRGTVNTTTGRKGGSNGKWSATRGG